MLTNIIVVLACSMIVLTSSSKVLADRIIVLTKSKITLFFFIYLKPLKK